MPLEHLSSPTLLSEDSVVRSLVFVDLCLSLCSLSFFFAIVLYCLSFIYSRVLITILVSANSEVVSPNPVDAEVYSIKHYMTVFEWLATGWCFSLGSSISSTNKTYSHDIAEILLKVTLKVINQINKHYLYMCTLQLSSHFPDTYGISKKCLKSPKGQPEAVNWMRTDNTITKPKMTKGQTTIYKTPHRKLKIEQQKVFHPTLNSIINRKYIRYMRMVIQYVYLTLLHWLFIPILVNNTPEVY